MDMKSLFSEKGVHAVVDGQFGSTGKGVLAAWLASEASKDGVKFTAVLSNAGPNSGHTFYDTDGNKHVLKQLPTFAVASLVSHATPITVFLTAGAIIDPAILEDEAVRYPGLSIYVHPNAAVITDEDRRSEADVTGSIAAVAGTRSGTGMALARKVMRDPSAVFSSYYREHSLPPNVYMGSYDYRPDDMLFMEVSQGFSLGINSEFYPKVTSRECTVMQGIADARVPAKAVSRVYVSARTFPIRVGNVDGFSSGEYYPDQEETSWEALGVEPELTTVTKRVRRVFTFSDIQIEEALRVNGADFLFMNFMNYIQPEYRFKFLAKLVHNLKSTGLIVSRGPTNNDVERVL